MCKGAHGGRTQRSDRHQQSNIDIVSSEKSPDLFTCRCQIRWVGNGAHERVMPLGHRANLARGRHLPKPVDWETDVEVLLVGRAIEVGADVRHDKIAAVDVAGHQAVVKGAERERPIVAAMQTRCSDDGDLAGCHRRAYKERSRLDVGHAIEACEQVFSFLRMKIGESDHGINITGARRSMAGTFTHMRLSDVEPASLSAEQQELADLVTGTRKGLGDDIWKRGPFGVWQHAPQVGLNAVGLGGVIRFGSSLADDVREVAICTVGAFHLSKFEFAAHKAIGIAAGLDADALDRLGAGEDTCWHGDLELAERYTRTLLHEHRIPDDLHAESVAAFGEAGTVELVTTIGYYCLISLTLNAFDVQLADGMDDPFPHAT
jgi:4-carboxymuconolactone decarboxylase